MNRAIHDWLRSDEDRMADRDRRIDRVMSDVDATRQRHRLWPLVPFGRRAMHSAAGADGVAALKGGVASLAPGHLMAVVALAMALTIGLVYIGTRPPDPTPMSAALGVDERDEALFERLQGLWEAGATDIAAVSEVYAEDAVHTSLWTNTVERFTGIEAIGDRMLVSRRVRGSSGEQRYRIGDSDDGAHRYLTIRPSIGSMPCVLWVKDERFTRHDCILPMAKTDNGPPALTSPVEGASEALAALVTAGWAGDEGAMRQAVSEDVVHQVAFDNHAVTHQGIDHYLDQVSPEAPLRTLWRSDLPAPLGELRWVDYSDVAGGTLCTFWAGGGKVVRHDCVVPASMVPVPTPDEP